MHITAKISGIVTTITMNVFKIIIFILLFTSQIVCAEGKYGKIEQDENKHDSYTRVNFVWHYFEIPTRLTRITYSKKDKIAREIWHRRKAWRDPNSDFVIVYTDYSGPEYDARKGLESLLELGTPNPDLLLCSDNHMTALFLDTRYNKISVIYFQKDEDECWSTNTLIFRSSHLASHLDEIVHVILSFKYRENSNMD